MQRFAQVGLVVNFDKCYILSAGDFLHSYTYLNRIQRHDLAEDEGILVLGTPVGGDEYVSRSLDSVVANVRSFCH